MGIWLIIGAPTAALVSLAATVYGLVKYHGQAKPWWIIACAVISAIMLVLTAYLIYELWQVLFTPWSE
jgi:hypothetical protein